MHSEVLKFKCIDSSNHSTMHQKLGKTDRQVGDCG